MFTNVIVGVDGYDGGRDAVALAGALCDGQITLVNVYPIDAVPSRASSVGFDQLLRGDAMKSIDAARSELPADVTIVGTPIADTSPARALQQYASEVDADLIVIGSAHHGRIGRLLLGDVGRNLIHGAPCPVAVAPKRFRGGPPRRIGVAFNGTPEAEAALDLAATYLRDHDATLTLCVAWESPATPISPGIYIADVDSLAERRRAWAEDLATETLKRLPESAEKLVLHGRAEQLIEEVAEQDFDLVICGSRGWGPVKRVAIGSTSDHLVHHTPCPVIVVPRPAAVEASDAVPVSTSAATK